MFFPGSRYEALGTYTITRPDGTPVAVTRTPLLRSPSDGAGGAARLLGFHRRHEGQRLDHLAAHYLKDATMFWRLCDGNGTPAPDALAARELIGIPAPEEGR
jgi:hypothetical protein